MPGGTASRLVAGGWWLVAGVYLVLDALLVAAGLVVRRRRDRGIS
ncbi:hypothetical protein [Actinoplanes auranticolor]|nr:hypothetical protein [Actinoplanes auranticolor]